MKQWKKQFKKNTIRYNIFFSMLFPTAFLIIFLSLGTSCLFLRNSFSLKKEAAFQQLEYISDHLTFMMDSAENYSKAIISNTDVQQFMKEAFYHPLNRSLQKNDKEMQQLILRIIQSTHFIHSVTLYTPDNMPLIATEPYSQSHLSFPLPDRLIWGMREKQDIVNSRKRISVLSLQSPFYDTASGQLLGYIEIAIPEKKIANIYHDIAVEDTILMIDRDGLIQSCENNDLLHSEYAFLNELSSAKYTSVSLAHSTLFFYRYFPTLGWYIVNEVPLITFLQPLLILFLISLSMTVLAIILYIGVSHRISHTITAPLQDFVRHIEEMHEEELHTIKKIPCTSEIETLVHSFNSMVLAQNEIKLQLLGAETSKQILSLSLLQQQINPHFLYNTLDNICSLAELEEKETLIQLVMNLSAFYRSCLSNGKMQITLKQELKISESYLEILHIRYPNKFTYDISCPEELMSCSCIKLLLQPIIENSIYHGIKELEKKGIIRIDCRPAQDTIQIILQDNGIGLTAEQLEQIWTQKNDHFGIQNIHQRIHLYYGDAYGLSMEIPAEGGCKTTITIPRKETYPCQST